MTFHVFQRAGAPAVVVLAALAGCSGQPGPAVPAPTATVTTMVTTTRPTPPIPSAGSPAPSGSARPVADPTRDDNWPVISASSPSVFGGAFQADPGHDFSRGISPSRDGVLRGRLRAMRDANVAEYVPVRWVRDAGGQTAGHFEGPPQGDVMAFAAPIAKDVVFLSATGCDGTDQTINSAYVGTERCSRDRLISLADRGELYALITVRNGRIVKVVEIYAP